MSCEYRNLLYDQKWSTVIQTLDGRVATVVVSFYSLAVHLAILGRN